MLKSLLIAATAATALAGSGVRETLAAKNNIDSRGFSQLQSAMSNLASSATVEPMQARRLNMVAEPHVVSYNYADYRFEECLSFMPTASTSADLTTTLKAALKPVYKASYMTAAIRDLLAAISDLNGGTFLHSYNPHKCDFELKKKLDMLFWKEKELAAALLAIDQVAMDGLRAALPAKLANFDFTAYASQYFNVDNKRVWFMQEELVSYPCDTDLASLAAKIEKLSGLLSYIKEQIERALYLTSLVGKIADKIDALTTVAPKFDYSTPVAAGHSYAGYEYDNELLYRLKGLAFNERDLVWTVKAIVKADAKIQHVAFAQYGRVDFEDYWCPAH